MANKIFYVYLYKTSDKTRHACLTYRAANAKEAFTKARDWWLAGLSTRRFVVHEKGASHSTTFELPRGRKLVAN